MRRLPSLLVGSALVLTACGGGGGGTPAEQLASAFENLRGTPFSYEVSLDIDNSVLQEAAAANPELGQASLFAGSFKMSGVYNDDDAEFTVGVMGSDALQVRLIDDHSKIYAKLGIMDLLGGLGMSPDQLMAEAQASGDVPLEAEELLNAMFAGGWVGFEYDEDALTGLYDDAGADAGVDTEAIREAFGDLNARLSDPAGMIEDFTTSTEGDEVDGARTFAVDIKLRSALGALAQDVRTGLEASASLPGLSDMATDIDSDLQDFDEMLQEGLAEVPESVPGLTIAVRDGYVDRITFDIGVAAAALGNDDIPAGSALIQIAIDRDDVPTIEEPDADVFYTTEDLAAFLESMG